MDHQVVTKLGDVLPLTVRRTTSLASEEVKDHFSRGYVVYTADQAGFQYNDARSGQEAVGMFMEEYFNDLVQYEKPETGVYLNNAQLGDTFFYPISRNFYATSHANKVLKRYGLAADSVELRQRAAHMATTSQKAGWAAVCTEVDSNGRGRLAIIGTSRIAISNGVRYEIAYVFGAELGGSHQFVNLAPFDSRTWYGINFWPNGVIDWSNVLT